MRKVRRHLDIRNTWRPAPLTGYTPGDCGRDSSARTMRNCAHAEYQREAQAEHEAHIRRLKKLSGPNIAHLHPEDLPLSADDQNGAA